MTKNTKELIEFMHFCTINGAFNSSIQTLYNIKKIHKDYLSKEDIEAIDRAIDSVETSQREVGKTIQDRFTSLRRKLEGME